MRALTEADFRQGRLRGFGFGDVHGPGRMAEEGFDRLAATGANCVRAAFVPTWDGRRYVMPRVQLARLDWTAHRLRERGVYLIPALAIPEDDHVRLWNVKGAAASLVDVLVSLARHFRGRSEVAGIDLLNEPKLFLASDQEAYWRRVVFPGVQAVQAVDSARVCIVQTWPGGRVDSVPEWGDFWRDVPGTVMSAHLYSPFEYTHRGLMPWTTPGIPFDMRTTLQAQHAGLLYLRNEALRFNKAVWIGEMSTRQDDPAGLEWTRHALQLIEGFQFSASWHYFIGPPEWHPSDDTLGLLKAWISRSPLKNALAAEVT